VILNAHKAVGVSIKYRYPIHQKIYLLFFDEILRAKIFLYHPLYYKRNIGDVPQLTVQLFYYFTGGSCVCLFFEWPKKRHQKKGHPTIWSLRDFPALLAFIGAKINSLRSNKFLLIPMKAAMLGCIEGTKVKGKNHRTRPIISVVQDLIRHPESR